MDSILDEAKALVHGSRGEDYGHPLFDFTRVAGLWSVILEHPVTPEQVPLCMIALKISRQMHRPKRDNLVDMCGCAETAQMVEELRCEETVKLPSSASGKSKRPKTRSKRKPKRNHAPRPLARMW